MGVLLSSAAALLVTTLLLSTTVLLLLLPAAARAQTTKEAAGDEQMDGEFSYNQCAENGPDRWGDIKPEWATCGNGSMQSPINLCYRRAHGSPSLGPLSTSYRPASATLVNTGHHIKVRFDGDAGSLLINGTAYHLTQLHWHTPSEHAIDGRRYDMELHMVHHSAEGGGAVIALLYKTGRHDDPFLRALEPFLRWMASSGSKEQPVRVVDPSDVRGFEYYRYMGSLTTPPCTEGVVWTVIKQIRTVSVHQIQLLRQAVNDGMENNARTLQKANNRDISVFEYIQLRESF